MLLRFVTDVYEKRDRLKPLQEALYQGSFLEGLL